MSIKTIVISNITEFNRRAMANNFSRSEFLAWDEASVALTDMSLFWCGDDKVVMLPCPPNASFLSDLTNALGYKNVRVIWPNIMTHSICDDIVNDKELFEELVQIIQNSNKPRIVSWGATTQFYALLKALALAGANFVAPEIPELANYWTALYFESKAGFREFAIKEAKTLNIPEGFVCGNKDVALDAIAYFSKNNKGFVLKANYGTGGFSTMCYPANQTDRGFEKIRKEVAHRMAFDHFWDNPPVIIEEHILGGENSLPTSLTIDFCINQDGLLNKVGGGKMIMRRGWLYAGIHCGKGVLDTDTENKITKAGFHIGEQMAKTGYRGWFDVDFVQRWDGEIFLTEINARRASPVHVFDIATQILGDNWEKEWSLYANDHLSLQGACQPTYTNIRDAIADFNNNESSVQAIPTIISNAVTRKNPFIGYAVIAPNASEASNYATLLETQIKKIIGMSN
jgi:hypothetical protein